MKHFNATFTAGVLATLLSTSAAQALTADQVWTRWQETLAGVGLAIAAEGNSNEGGVLTLTNVTIRPAIAQSSDDATGTIAEVTMTENSDGTVEIGFAPEFSLPVAGIGGLTVTQENLTLTASEVDGGVSYDFEGDALTIAAEGSEPAEGGAGTSLKFNMALTEPSGSYSDALTDTREIALSLNAPSITYDVETSDPAASTSSVQNSTSADMVLNLAVSLPASFAAAEVQGPQDFSAAIKDGLTITADFATGASTGTGKEENPMFSYDLTSTGLPSKGTLSVDANGLAAAVTGEGGSVAATSPMLPVPVNVNIGPVEMNIQVPLVATEPQDFRYMVKLSDLVVNEEAWSLIDAGQTLPRDPIQFSVDVTGKATMDVFALAAAEEGGMTEMTPPTIESLTIADLGLSIAGAAISGTGAFTFDNSSMVPVPAGTADVKLDGANGLMDKLVALGLLPQDQADQARMMSGMFFAPGDGEDSLVSKIEAKEDGSVFVNGMQVQ